MNRQRATRRRMSLVRGVLVADLALALVLLAARPGFAAPDAYPSRQEADKHFEHGVALYMEADYRAALVEFLRAYELAPNGVVLFNIGETQYQLRDYASALATFERYLAESPQTDSHRALVEANIKELRTRVGRLTIATYPVGAEITVDDRVIGKTPFDKPVVVGIGRLNVRAYLPGHLPVTRAVDVAAEDNLSISFDLPAAASVRADAPVFAPAAINTSDEPPRSISRSAWRKAGWITAGMLAAGAAGVALWARDESRVLRDARNAFPANAAQVSRLSDKTLTLSVVADALAAAALVVGGITLSATVTAKDKDKDKDNKDNKDSGLRWIKVTAGLGSMTLQTTF